MGASEDVVAKTVLATYDSLSPKYKPAKATEEFFQWVPLSGIVATEGTHVYKEITTPSMDQAETLRTR